jgi:hypothetical protein
MPSLGVKIYSIDGIIYIYSVNCVFFIMPSSRDTIDSPFLFSILMMALSAKIYVESVNCVFVILYPVNLGFLLTHWCGDGVMMGRWSRGKSPVLKLSHELERRVQ